MKQKLIQSYNVKTILNKCGISISPIAIVMITSCTIVLAYKLAWVFLSSTNNILDKLIGERSAAESIVGASFSIAWN